MISTKRSVLPFFFLLVFCVGCGLNANARLRSGAKEINSLNEKIADQMDLIRDEATLKKNSPKILANYRKLMKVAKKLEGMRGTKQVVEAVKADLLSTKSRLESQVMSSFRRIARIPGGKKLIRSIVDILEANGTMVNPAIKRLLSEDSFPTLRMPDRSSMRDRSSSRSFDSNSRERQHSRNRASNSENYSNFGNPWPRGFGRSRFPHGSNKKTAPKRPSVDLSKKTTKELVFYCLHAEELVAIDAVKRINGVDPSTISSELKGEIARTLKKVAYNPSNSDQLRSNATKGMVIWGGKFCVPFLIELLDSSGSSQQSVILKALVDYENYTAIEPVAKVLAQDNHNREAAAEYLAKAGPDAEQPVLDYVRPTSLFLTSETVKLLGKIGTKKSLTALVRLKRVVPYYYRETENEIIEARNAILGRMEKDEP